MVNNTQIVCSTQGIPCTDQGIESIQDIDLYSSMIQKTENCLLTAWQRFLKNCLFSPTFNGLASC